MTKKLTLAAVLVVILTSLPAFAQQRGTPTPTPAPTQAQTPAPATRVVPTKTVVTETKTTTTTTGGCICPEPRVVVRRTASTPPPPPPPAPVQPTVVVQTDPALIRALERIADKPAPVSTPAPQVIRVEMPATAPAQQVVVDNEFNKELLAEMKTSNKLALDRNKSLVWANRWGFISAVGDGLTAGATIKTAVDSGKLVRGQKALRADVQNNTLAEIASAKQMLEVARPNIVNSFAATQNTNQANSNTAQGGAGGQGGGGGSSSSTSGTGPVSSGSGSTSTSGAGSTSTSGSGSTANGNGGGHGDNNHGGGNNGHGNGDHDDYDDDYPDNRGGGRR